MSLLDHRRTPFEAERAMPVIRPQLLVGAAEPPKDLLRGYMAIMTLGEFAETVAQRAGQTQPEGTPR